MNNAFYAYLNNRTRAAMVGIIGADWLPEGYVPVARHEIYRQLSELLLDDNPQQSQYWICRARQTIRSTALKQYISTSNLEGGHLVDELAAWLGFYLRPVLNGSEQLEFFGKLSSRSYDVSSYEVSSAESPDRVILQSGDRTYEAEVISGSARIATGGTDEVGIVIPLSKAAGVIRWASTPSETVSQRLHRVLPAMLPLLTRLDEIPSCLSASDVSYLASLASNRSQPALAFTAGCILIAAHTAAVAEDTL